MNQYAAERRYIMDWIKMEWIIKNARKLIFVLAICGFVGGLLGNNALTVLISLVLIFVVMKWNSNWSDVWAFIKERNWRWRSFESTVAEKKELARPPGEQPEYEPGSIRSIRDNFIYLGNHSYRKGVWDDAFQFFLAANRMNSSILTCFRCMQCLSFIALDSNKTAREISILFQNFLTFYDKALAHADGPQEKLRDRVKFAEWIRQRRDRRFEPDFAKELSIELRKVDF